MWGLDGARPYGDRPLLIEPALPAKWLGFGPGSHNELERLFQSLSRLGWVHVIGDILVGRAAQHAGNQSSARKRVQHGEFFRHAYRIENGDGSTQQGDPGAF